MVEHYFVRKVATLLSGERQFHLLSLTTGKRIKAQLDRELSLNPIFPGMTYRASIVKRRRGSVITSFSLALGKSFEECLALADFVSTQNALPLYAAPHGVRSILFKASLSEGKCVRKLLDHKSYFILEKYIGDAQAAQLQFAWEDYLAFQASVVENMHLGFSQITAERMVQHLSVDANGLIDNPLMAIPFVEAEDIPALLSSSKLTAGMKHAWELLRYLEAQSLAGNTVVEVASILGSGSNDQYWGDHLFEPAGGSKELLEALRECERHRWIIVTEGLVQFQSNYRLQNAVRDQLTRICRSFHPSYSKCEIEHAFNRLSAFIPDLFAQKMLDEVSMALNSRVLLVRYNDIRAANQFTQQYCAVFELLTNIIPTLVTTAKARCLTYEHELGIPHTPFYEIINGTHGRAVVVQQSNLLPLFELSQLLAELGDVITLVALVDVTLPANAAIEQMSRYFPTVDICIRQQVSLPIQQPLRKLSEIESRINAEDIHRIAVICDCLEIAQLLNCRYSSVPTNTKVPKKGDLIRLAPLGLRHSDDALIRIVNVRPNELFVLHSHTYRTIKADEFARYSWEAGFVLSPSEALGVELPQVLVFTSTQRGAGGDSTWAAFVRNLRAQGVRVIEHCIYEIDGSPRLASPGTLQRIVPLAE